MLHQKIIENTKASLDQEHFDTIHISMPAYITDRTDYILHKEETNPAYGAYRCIKQLSQSQPSNTELIVGVPCNSFHAPPIFNTFYKLSSSLGNVTVLNMLSSTIYFIQQNYPLISKIGILSTTGTRICGSYLHYFNLSNYYKCIQVSSSMQSILHQTIYDKKWGLKSNFPPTQQAKDILLKLMDELIEQGAETIILGCTELPLAIKDKYYKNVPILDPMDVLARSMIEYADSSKLKCD